MTLAPTLAAARAHPPQDGRWLLAGTLGASDAQGAFQDGPAELVVKGGVITTLQWSEGAEGQRGSGDDGLVLAPLLVNGHDHGRGRGNVLAGVPDAPLEPWILSLRDLGVKSTQESLVGDASRMMLSAGVGGTVICVNPQSDDTAGEVEAAAAAAVKAGIRAAIVFPFADAMTDLYGRAADAPGWSAAEFGQRLDLFESVAARCADPLVELQLGPVGPQWVSESTLAAIGTHARQTGRRVHMHLLESRAQRRWADETYPAGLLDFLADVDLLGPHVCLAHGTQLRPDEMARLAASGCVLTLNASSNLRLASGIAPIAEAQRAGVAIAAGLDGLALGDDGDFWNELRLFRGIGQAQSGRSMDAGKMLHDVGAGGRAALGGCAPQEVRAGNVADFVLVDMSGYQHLLDQKGWSVADVLVAAGSPARVREVWVGGRQTFSQVTPGQEESHHDA
ncbi:MAG TPA: amidohydrolase family protein [Acidimicrobiales bacterium]|jgi:cytosine/adenosine deaminase-related metal-dependent hydrolase|nr:amidohydrolase family protein [Acidimicrobiales bacterium]